MRMVETMRAIDADALKKIWCDDCENKHLCEDGTPACYDVQQVDALPTIEAEPKHGRWIYIRDEENNGLYECSECHKGDIHAKECKVPYCWNCGAKMDQEDE